MASDADAPFLRAVVAAPDDDLPSPDPPELPVPEPAIRRVIRAMEAMHDLSREGD